MLNFPVSNKELAGWSRRVGRSLDVGLDIIKVLKREGEYRSGSSLWRKVAQSVAQGNSLSEAFEEHRDQLNNLFLSMVKVGEETGHLGQMLTELADYYDQLVSMRRAFWRSILVSIIQLGIALGIVGLIILLRAFLPNLPDISGFGLAGVSGLIKYLLFLTLLFGGGWGLYWYFKTNIVHLYFVHYVIDPIPQIGSLFRTLAMFRLTKSLALTLGTGMEVKTALTYSFQAAAYGPISKKLATVLREIDEGETLEPAFAACHIFDPLLLMHLESSEEAGMIPEVMERLSREYFQDCLLRLKTLSVIGYFLVFALIAGIMIFFIFRMFMSYLQSIQEFLP